MSNAWYYRSGKTTRGPISGDELKKLSRSGAVQPDDLVCREGTSEWISASTIKGLIPTAPPPRPDASRPKASRNESAAAGAAAPGSDFAFDNLDSGTTPPPNRRRPPSRRTAAIIGGGFLIVVIAMCAGLAWYGSRSNRGGEPEKEPPPYKGKGEKLASFDSVPANVQRAVKEGKTVWVLDNFNGITLGEGMKGERSALYLVFQEGKLVSYVYKSNTEWCLQVRGEGKGLTEYAVAETYPAGRHESGGDTGRPGFHFKFDVEGSHDAVTRIDLRFHNESRSDANPNNVITSESTIRLTLVWNKGGDKGSWEATEEGWTQLVSLGKDFGRKPNERSNHGFASRLSDDGYRPPATPTDTAKEHRPELAPPTKKDDPTTPAPTPPGPPKEPSPAKPQVVAIHKIVFAGNCILTRNEEELARIKERHPGPFNGTTGHYAEILGYGYTSEQPGTVPLRRYKVGAAHLFTTKVIETPGYEEQPLGLWVPAKEGPNASVRLAFKKKNGSMQYGRKSDAAAARKEGYQPTGDEFFMLDKPSE